MRACGRCGVQGLQPRGCCSLRHGVEGWQRLQGGRRATQPGSWAADIAWCMLMPDIHCRIHPPADCCTQLFPGNCRRRSCRLPSLTMCVRWRPSSPPPASWRACLAACRAPSGRLPVSALVCWQFAKQVQGSGVGLIGCVQGTERQATGERCCWPRLSCRPRVLCRRCAWKLVTVVASSSCCVLPSRSQTNLSNPPHHPCQPPFVLQPWSPTWRSWRAFFCRNLHYLSDHPLLSHMLLLCSPGHRSGEAGGRQQAGQAAAGRGGARGCFHRLAAQRGGEGAAAGAQGPVSVRRMLSTLC